MARPGRETSEGPTLPPGSDVVVTAQDGARLCGFRAGSTERRLTADV